MPRMACVCFIQAALPKAGQECAAAFLAKFARGLRASGCGTMAISTVKSHGREKSVITLPERRLV